MTLGTERARNGHGACAAGATGAHGWLQFVILAKLEKNWVLSDGISGAREHTV